jgi:hypothetical protein
MIQWYDIKPQDALALDLATQLEITAPLNEMGERCPWPWEPQQLVGVPMGQYHCGYCGAMVLAGIPHLDYAGGVDDGPSDMSDDPEARLLVSDALDRIAGVDHGNAKQGLDDTPSSP